MDRSGEPNYITGDRFWLNREKRSQVVAECKKKLKPLKARKEEILERYGLNNEKRETRTDNNEGTTSLTGKEISPKL